MLKVVHGDKRPSLVLGLGERSEGDTKRCDGCDLLIEDILKTEEDLVGVPDETVTASDKFSRDTPKGTKTFEQCVIYT